MEHTDWFSSCHMIHENPPPHCPLRESQTDGVVGPNDIENQSSLAGTIPRAMSALEVDFFTVLTLSYSFPLHPTKVLPDKRERLPRSRGWRAWSQHRPGTDAGLSLWVRIIMFMWAWAALAVLGRKKKPYECWVSGVDYTERVLVST